MSHAAISNVAPLAGHDSECLTGSLLSGLQTISPVQSDALMSVLYAKGYTRVIFEELIGVMHAVSRASALGTEGVCVTELCLMEAAREALPFQLTGGQERALDNVLRDMQGPLPMMCLLQVPAPPLKESYRAMCSLALTL